MKIRGYRIELGEIEAVLEGLPGVRQAVVAAREDTPGDLRLVAYLTEDRPVEEAALRASLAARLPEHMVPAHFVTLAEFPLTPNKKVDRKAFARANRRRSARRGEAFVAPESDIEARIAAIWSRILGVAEIGAKDNFFALGGHSLLAVQAHREICEELGRASSASPTFSASDARGARGPYRRPSEGAGKRRRRRADRRTGAGALRRDVATARDARKPSLPLGVSRLEFDGLAVGEAPADLAWRAKALFGPDVAVAALDPRHDHPGPCPGGGGDGGRPAWRRREFAAGRVAAHRAMAALGAPVWLVPAGPDPRAGLAAGSGRHQPRCRACLRCWPAARRCARSGSISSPTHCSIPRSGTASASPRSAPGLAARPAGDRGRLARLIFSAKEAVYKLQYPLTGCLFVRDDSRSRSKARPSAPGSRTPSALRLGRPASRRLVRRRGRILTGAALAAAPDDRP